jgi:phage terminase large subunit-like protein
MQYNASWLALQPQSMQSKFLLSLTSSELETLEYDWNFWARDKQHLPAAPFFVWLILAGRGFGKSRTGAETVRRWVRNNKYVNLIGATADDARDIMIEGESGIMAICPNGERPLYVSSKRRLEWPNGAISLIFTADEPKRLRGKQHYKIWADEMASWSYPESWDQAMLGLRLGNNPQAIVTTTPRPIKLITDLVNDPRNIVTTGSTYENRANLADGFFRYVISKYEGTRLGMQELEAKILTDTPGALWLRTKIDESRETKHPDLTRVVIGVDPMGSVKSEIAEAGIVAAGISGDHCYTIGDYSLHGSPEQWGRAVVTAYHLHMADCVAVESNFGGDMVESTIKQIDKTVNVKQVHASRGKEVRAEPISAIAAQGRDHHVGFFPKLEDELCTWVPGERSPNRLDAKVWAITELMGIDQEAQFGPSPFVGSRL